MYYYTIYRITNNINGKFYIGKHKTTNLDDGYMGSGKLIKRAIEKYGSENFTKEILYVFHNEEEMSNKEKELVVLNEMSYNLSPGGTGGRNLTSEEAKLMRAKRTAKCYVTPQCHEGKKRKYPNGTFFNKKHKEETKLKIAQANRKMIGEKNSQFGTCWITNEIVNVKIKRSEVDKWTKSGYRLGRKLTKREINHDIDKGQ